jgi:hypothetical protein
VILIAYQQFPRRISAISPQPVRQLALEQAQPIGRMGSARSGTPFSLAKTALLVKHLFYPGFLSR